MYFSCFRQNTYKRICTFERSRKKVLFSLICDYFTRKKYFHFVTSRILIFLSKTRKISDFSSSIKCSWHTIIKTQTLYKMKFDILLTTKTYFTRKRRALPGCSRSRFRFVGVPRIFFEKFVLSRFHTADADHHSDVDRSKLQAPATCNGENGSVML